MLEEVKRYLRVDGDEEDKDIESFINAAKEDLIDAGVSEEQLNTDSGKTAIKIIVGSLYDGEESKLSKTLLNIVTKLKYRGDTS
ncbi:MULTISPECIES: head-tail connector protein [Bacillus cereus group]|uniref:head-tail connector protein n=1 Tax=Bacillus cereus group TaxID=86661 RepID=UPI001AEE9657|nr:MULTISPECIES: head-tail connector protein [Bacillus cereus group]EMA6341688.1 phage gp6-like head-tail connector protein [Bacillus cytotoxicus]QTR79151.1 phage gp6-like head-tail connector protein [Bacillus cytotoxicus]